MRIALIIICWSIAWGTGPIAASAAESPTNQWTQWQHPLAQEYITVHRVRDLPQADQWICVGSPDLLRLPSGRWIASMELWLQTPTSGIEGGIDYPNHCLIKASDDGSTTWRQIATTGVTWGSLFYVHDALFLIGNDPRTRTIIITRSTDQGETWAKPVTLFDDSHYHGAATPVLVKEGYLYRAFEDQDRGSASCVIAGNLSQDLLDPSSWRMSNKVEPPRQTPHLSRGLAKMNPRLAADVRDKNWFLEGNVVDIRGKIHVLLRTRIDQQLTAGMTSVCQLDDDGSQMNYRFVQFYPMVGGQNKFKILYDHISQLYWTCTAFVPDPYQDPEPLTQRGFKGNPGNMRRMLMLCYSLDGLNWLPAGCVAMSRNPLESFHYSSQAIDGDDLLVLSRSSVGGELPYSNHDSNMITLHRVRDFRKQAINLRPAESGIAVQGLRCEYRVSPQGIDAAEPRLGWQITADRRGVYQQAYQIQVASDRVLLDADEPDMWDSGRVAGRETQHVIYGGEPLASRQQCYWRVRAWDEADRVSAWSEPAEWSMGSLSGTDWQAKWIGLDTRQLNRNPELELPPSPFLRKPFALAKPVRRATLYATALGLYEISLNGTRVGDRRLTPGWTDYNKRVYYQTYDVTEHLQQGSNAIGAILSPGWYCGYVGYALLVNLPQHKDFYGEVPALFCQLEIEYADGTTATIVSDESWKASAGPILESDLLMGVTYDARQELVDWNTTAYDDSGWQTVQVLPGTPGQIQAQPHEPVRITQVLPAQRLLQSPNGNYMFDFGQNFAGTVRLRIRGEAGQTVTIRYGEMLHPDGRLMTENLRRARATDTYICRGDPSGETWTPRFTFHGFQYAEISGLTASPALDMLTGLVLGSDTEVAGEFACSSPIINQLYRNIVWTQRANFIEIPTDCPQRDERLGWTGDAQIYVRSAAWNMHVPSFFTKWARDCADAQRKNGTFPNFVPAPYARPNKPYSPAWMEAGILCPLTIHDVYGDLRILAEHYAGYQRFIEFHLKKAGPGYVYQPGSWDELDPDGGWGDWLFLGTETPKEYIATCYFGLSLKTMVQIAELTGHTADAQTYERHFAEFKEAFVRAYSQPDGTLAGDTQTVYTLAIAMDLLPAPLKEKAGRRLVELIDQAGGKMQTGFLGTKHLLPVLTEIGRSDLAYKLLTNTDFPGWGYEVVNGATTIWERWNSYTREDGFGQHNAGMNSFSHYAFGAVCAWMFEQMAGIQAASPGFQKIVFRPELERLSHIGWVRATYNSYHGPIGSAWHLIDNGAKAELTFRVPANTTAIAYVPCTDAAAITEGGHPLGNVQGVKLLSITAGRAKIGLASGTYHFETELPPPVVQGIAVP